MLFISSLLYTYRSLWVKERVCIDYWKKVLGVCCRKSYFAKWTETRLFIIFVPSLSSLMHNVEMTLPV